MALQKNLAFDLGETWIIDHTSYDYDGVTPLDLTGGSVVLYVKGAITALIGAGNQTLTLTSPTLGQSRIVVTPAQQTSAGVTVQVARYLIRTTLADGTVSDQNYGAFNITATAAT